MDYRVIYVFFAIIFAINIIQLGTGVYQISDLSGPFKSLFEDLTEEDIKSGNANITEINYDADSTSSDTYNQLPLYKSDGFLAGFSTFLYFITGAVFGYTAVLNAIGAPYLISFLIIVMISTFQIVASIFMVKDVWTAIWGVR